MKHSLLAAAFLGLSDCSPFEQAIKTLLADVASSGINLEVATKAVPADFSPETEISTGDKIKAILKEFKQPGDYRIDGMDLSSKEWHITIEFDYCYETCTGNRLYNCNDNLSLILQIFPKYIDGVIDYRRIFLAVKYPYGSADYLGSCNEFNPCRNIPPELKALADEMFHEIVHEGYQEIIKDKPHSIDSKVETIFQNLTDF